MPSTVARTRLHWSGHSWRWALVDDMTAYIKRLVQDLIEAHPDTAGPELTVEYQGLLQAVVAELERLDPRDFSPDARYEFVRIRGRMKHVSQYPGRLSLRHGNLPPLLNLLDCYEGEGTRAETRTFPFVRDPQLREIVARDYRELSTKLLPSEAWKSSVVLAGSILESILLDQLTVSDDVRTRALSCRSAPRDRTGTVLSLESWKLHSMISVATEIGILPEARSRTVDQVLRDFRNFVHPKKEIRSAHPCTEAEAWMSKGALDGVCNHLQG